MKYQVKIIQKVKEYKQVSPEESQAIAEEIIADPQIKEALVELQLKYLRVAEVLKTYPELVQEEIMKNETLQLNIQNNQKKKIDKLEGGESPTTVNCPQCQSSYYSCGALAAGKAAALTLLCALLPPPEDLFCEGAVLINLTADFLACQHAYANCCAQQSQNGGF